MTTYRFDATPALRHASIYRRDEVLIAAPAAGAFA
jgi:hypothetical protein